MIKKALIARLKKSLEKQVENNDQKLIFFDMMLYQAVKEYNSPIKMNSLPRQL